MPLFPCVFPEEWMSRFMLHPRASSGVRSKRFPESSRVRCKKRPLCRNRNECRRGLRIVPNGAAARAESRLSGSSRTSAPSPRERGDRRFPPAKSHDVLRNEIWGGYQCVPPGVAFLSDAAKGVFAGKRAGGRVVGCFRHRENAEIVFFGKGLDQFCRKRSFRLVDHHQRHSSSFGISRSEKNVTEKRNQYRRAMKERRRATLSRAKQSRSFKKSVSALRMGLVF